MISALNPFMRQLSHISHLAPSAADAAAVKKKVWLQLEDLARDAVNAIHAAGEPVVPQKPPAKKLKFTVAAGSDDDNFFLRLC